MYNFNQTTCITGSNDSMASSVHCSLIESSSQNGQTRLMDSTGYIVKQGNTVKLPKMDKLSSLAQVV